MKYNMNFNKAVNRLVPPFMRGRKFVLFIQSLVSPLQRVNDDFVSYTAEKRIEACMTSQVIKLQWYLNRKLNSNFTDPTASFSVLHGQIQGLSMYHQRAYNTGIVPPARVLRDGSDGAAITNNFYLKYFAEQGNEGSFSFRVISPAISSSVDRDAYINEIRVIVDRYRLSNKTYTIIVPQNA